jgi:thiol-disulfide isomerase/thioredoxin
MRLFLAAACCFVLAACGDAQEKTKKPALAVGDPAPALAVTTWLTGSPVKSFEPGKVYVVEFWATWCGPCIASMPHLGGLQAEYKDQGLVIVGLTNKDPNNTQDKVVKFVDKRGKRFGYTFAWCETDAMQTAYMDAAEQQGIPCSFVVDKGGKLAFIGHPMELDGVLPKVLAGTWKGEEDLKALRAANEAADKEMQSIFRKIETDPAAVLDGLASFATRHPDKAKDDMFRVRTVVAQIKAKKYDDAKAASEALIKKGVERSHGELLGYVASVWAAKELNPERKNTDLAQKAIEAILKVEGEDDIQALVTAAQTYQALDLSDKANEYIGKAIKAADDPRTKAQLEQIADQMKKDAEKKKEGDKKK